MTSSGDPTIGSWPGLTEAQQEAARRGASSVGTQHVLFALLAGHDDDTLAALAASGVDPGSAAVALDRIVGLGGPLVVPVNAESVTVSSRVEQILRDAAGDDRSEGHRELLDRDVLRALLTSDDPAVGHLVVEILGNPRKVVDALDRRADARR